MVQASVKIRKKNESSWNSTPVTDEVDPETWVSMSSAVLHPWPGGQQRERHRNEYSGYQGRIERRLQLFLLFFKAEVLTRPQIQNSKNEDASTGNNTMWKSIAHQWQWVWPWECLSEAPATAMPQLCSEEHNFLVSLPGKGFVIACAQSWKLASRFFTRTWAGFSLGVNFDREISRVPINF